MKMDENYFKEKLLRIREGSLLKQIEIINGIARDQREADIEKIEKLIDKTKYQSFATYKTILDQAIAALREK
jgi:hypothetical protein